MSKYEYKIVQSKAFIDDDESLLNDLGQQGWRVVGVDNYHPSTEGGKYILMREI